MKHSLDDLLDIVYRYYPRGIGDDRYKKTEEYARLVTARQRAATDQRWHAMRSRISQRFPDRLTNWSLHLPTGELDACYSISLSLSEAATPSNLWCRVSFLALYYIIYSKRLIDVVQPIEGFNLVVHGMNFYIPRSAVGLKFMSGQDHELPTSATTKQGTVTFDLSDDEQLYAEWLIRDIEATFGCERMPPEIGTALVPDVTTDARALGEARLYDCLFSDGHEWVNPSPSGGTTRVQIDADRLPEPFTEVITVLAALYHSALALIGPDVQTGYWVASTDGVLRKDEMLQTLAKLRLQVESPKALRANAAARELEALIVAWDGKGAPPDAMIAWGKGFLRDLTEL